MRGFLQCEPIWGRQLQEQGGHTRKLSCSGTRSLHTCEFQGKAVAELHVFPGACVQGLQQPEDRPLSETQQPAAGSE